jgi:hypothetical protein
MKTSEALFLTFSKSFEIKSAIYFKKCNYVLTRTERIFIIILKIF